MLLCIWEGLTFPPPSLVNEGLAILMWMASHPPLKPPSIKKIQHSITTNPCFFSGHRQREHLHATWQHNSRFLSRGITLHITVFLLLELVECICWINFRSLKKLQDVGHSFEILGCGEVSPPKCFQDIEVYMKNTPWRNTIIHEGCVIAALISQESSYFTCTSLIELFHSLAYSEYNCPWK